MVGMVVIVVDSISPMEIAVGMAVMATMVDIVRFLVSLIRINALRKTRPKMMIKAIARRVL